MFEQRIKIHHSAMAESRDFIRGPRNTSVFLGEEGLKTIAKDKGTIYIHVPFCSKICSFCNMRRTLQKPKEDYHTWIIEEIKHYAALAGVQETVFDAIYFGGGTPTTLEPKAIEAILIALKENFILTKEVEITIETTVTELTDMHLQVFKEQGVTRFSVGIQTFNDKGRAIMGRKGDGKTAYEKLAQIKQMGFETVSIDLIYNYPGQTKEDLEEDLEKIITLDLDGFSMYSLIDMKHTKIDSAQSMENDTKFFYQIANKMGSKGYHFLELTKMVKSDRYKYVMNRHQGADTLPLGAGAGGSIGGLMLMNPIQLKDYHISVQEFNERQGVLFGPEYKEINLFKGSIQRGYLPEIVTENSRYKHIIQDLELHKYIQKQGDKYQLTTQGVFWGNNISRLLCEVKNNDSI